MKKFLVAVVVMFMLLNSFSLSAETLKEENGEALYVLNDDMNTEIKSAQLTLKANGETANLTTKYQFYNPTSNLEILKMAIKASNDALIKTDGLAVNSKLQHAITDNPLFLDEYYSEGIYNYSQKIFKLTYNLSSDAFEDYPSLVISALVDFDAEKTHFITSTDNIEHELIGMHTITNWVSKGTNFELYIIGEDVNEINWKFYKNSRLLQEVEGKATLVSKDEILLKDFLLSDKLPEVSEVDWYNNKIRCLLDDKNAITSVNELLIAKRLESFLVYQVAVAGKATVLHEVSYPLVVKTDDSYKPAIYQHQFNLNNFKKFAKITDVTLTIDSDLYLFNPQFAYGKDKTTAITNFDNPIMVSLSTSANPEPNIDMLELSIKIIVSSIALIVLVALVVFPKKIRRNYRLNDYELQPKVERLYKIQNFLAFIAIILSLIGMHYKIYFSAIALAFVALAFIVALIAHFKALQANAVGIIALALAITSCANLLYYSHNIFELNTVIINVCILVYGINNLALYNNIEYNKEEDHYYLPLDFLSKKSFVIYVLFVLLIMMSGMVILMFWFKITYLIIVGIINLLAVVIYRVIKVYFVDYKAIKQYYKNLDYQSLKYQMELRLGNDMVHPKTYNGYLFRLAEIAIGNNMDDYLKYLSSYKPLAKLANQVDFDVLRLNYLLNRREFFGLYQDLRIKYAEHPHLLNKINKRYQYYLPYYNGEVSESIVLEYPYKTKNEWKNAKNLFIQIYHYVSRDNYGKARELGKIFKKKYSGLKLFNDEINKLNLNRL